MQLTRSQARALDDQKHLAIVANAGSGKTSVLVERYIHLLLAHDELTPRNLIAITFTDAAAAELRSRIAQALDNRIAEATDQAKLMRLVQIRNGLAGAYISTINAFALRVIRAYPVEAKIDSTFGMLTDTDLDLVIDEVIQSVFERLLTAAYAKRIDDDPILTTFRRLGRKELQEVISTMIKDRWKSRSLLKTVTSSSDADLIALWEAALSKILLPAVEKASKLLSVIAKLGKPGKKLTEFQLAFGKLGTSNSTKEKFVAYSSAMNATFTKQWTLYAYLVDKKAPQPELNEAGNALAILHKPIAALLDAYLEAQSDPDIESTYIQQLRATLNIYSEVEQAFVEAKATYGVLDFEDQIEKLYELLGTDEIAHELSESFAYLLIDEYQDTNRVQFEIAKRLTRELQGKTRLAIVGDPKQSIYSFRGADVETFNQTQQAILGQSDEGTDEERGLITLAESFRMADRPLLYVNSAFRKIMSTTVADIFGFGNTVYQELVAARSPVVEGGVEFLISSIQKKVSNGDEAEPNSQLGDEDQDASGELNEEFLLVAARIGSIVENRDGKYNVERKRSPEDPPDAQPTRSPEFKDIAILLRSRTSLDQLTRALTHVGVPYNVAKGVGFFEQQEVIDLVSYLNFLVRPNDDVSLHAILRSPIFAISDTVLFEMHIATKDRFRHGQSPALWERLQLYATTSTDRLVQRAVLRLHEDLSITGRIATSSMLEKILEQSGLEATYAGLPNGMQAIANMRKLVSIVRGYDSRGFVTMHDCVEKLRANILRDDREAQAPTSDEDAVRIMTIHGAKGLEFPFVFVVNLNGKTKNNSDAIIDPEFGIKFGAGDRLKSMADTYISASHAAKEFEERKRLLYVALTRARDHLFLSAAITDDSIGHASLLGLFDEATIETLCADSSALGIVEEIQRYDAATEQTTTKTATFSIPIIRKLEEIEYRSKNSGKIAELPEPSYHLERYNSARGLGRFSPTQVLSFAECPTKYYLKYLLGLPEDPRLNSSLEPDEHAERIEPTVFGELVHKLFERIDRITNAAGLDHTRFEQNYRSISATLGIRPDESTYHDLALQQTERFIQSDAAKLSAGGISHNEFLIQAALTDTDLIRGIIDRLIELENGDIRILDYKTDQRSPETSPAKEARHKFQMRFYAYLASLLFPEAKLITTTLYYTTFGTTQEYRFGRDDFAGIENELNSLINRIRGLEAITSLPQIDQNLDHCPECSFFDREQRTCSVNVAAQNPTEIPAR